MKFVKLIKPSIIWQSLLITLLISIAISTAIAIIKNEYFKDNIALFITLVIVNCAALYFITFYFRIKLIFMIDNNAIYYKLYPWHKRFRVINSKDVTIIHPVYYSNYIHIGIGFKNTTHYILGNGYCLYIKTKDLNDYLLSTGLEKDELVEVLNKYGYKVS
ncbi:MAG: hypothetical protein ACQPRH_04035 [Solitalea-like symbiont of Tyrophagus putrescentiae]